MTKYTFLLPAYKGRFLDEMLRSIQGQTYNDFKVIISDDCSPEDLRSICEPYLTDPRFAYRRNEENMGSKSLVSHWNLLVNMCDTDYLIMASDDDVYAPYFLDEIERLTVKYPEVDLFRARVNIIDGLGEIVEKDMLLEEYQEQLDFLYFFMGTYTLKCVSNFVYKTWPLKNKGGFFDLPLAWGSDNLTAILLSENGVGNTPSICFSFRSSGINISTAINLKNIREKTRARYVYMQNLEPYILGLSSKIKNSRREKELYEKIKDMMYKGFCVRKMAENCEKCAFGDMMRYYKYLKRIEYFTGKLDRIHFIWSWLRAYKTRTMN